MDAKSRRHFDAIAEAMARANERRMDDANATDPGLRILQGLAMGREAFTDDAIAKGQHERALGQAQLAAKWRELRARRGT